jgi:hypothetical protein
MSLVAWNRRSGPAERDEAQQAVIDLLGIGEYIHLNKARHASQRCAPWRATLFLAFARP